jgi:hypothetical protein
MDIFDVFVAHVVLDLLVLIVICYYQLFDEQTTTCMAVGFDIDGTMRLFCWRVLDHGL